MSETNIIREFLVRLGFQSDEAALKRFDSGIDKATKTVIKLATAIEGTALAVSAGVTRMASNLEALYFASIKAGDSAANLKAFDRGMQNLGTDAGEALESVQGLSRFLRENPGGEGLLASLGVTTRGPLGELRDTTDMMLELGERLAQMPYYLANQYAGIFGISEDTLRAMRSAGFAEEIERTRKRMAGTEWTKATVDAHQYMMQIRDLTTVLEAFGLQVFTALSRRLGVSVEQLTQWLVTKGPRVAERVAEIAVEILDVAEKIGRWIAWLVGKFVEWDDATNGWSTRLLGMLVILKLFGGAQIIGGVLALAAAFLKLGGGMITTASAGAGLLGLLSKLGLVGAAGAAGWFGGKAIYENALSDDWKDKIGHGIATVMSVLGHENAKHTLAINDPMTYLRLAGWSKDQAAGILANLQAESGMNPNAVGDHGKAYGLAQWHPDRQKAFEKFAGKDIRQSTQAEQLDFLTFELTRGAERQAGALLQAAQTARQSAEIMARYYERPANIEQAVAKRGQMAVHLAQETTINVNGGENPAATGRATANEQNRVNAELVRNLKVAVQ